WSQPQIAADLGISQAAVSKLLKRIDTRLLRELAESAEGCRLLATKPPVSMTELDIEGQKDPFRRERNEAGAAGGNALLVLSRMTVSRHDADCPTSSPITDCPPSSGAWFSVVLESYACTPDALSKLSTPPPKVPHTIH